MKENRKHFPLQIRIGFKKIFEAYDKTRASSNIAVNRVEEVLQLKKDFPQLSAGMETYEELQKYEKEIDIILDQIFPSVLKNKEIKFATVPFHNKSFKSTPCYKEIIESAGSDLNFDILNFDDEQFYMMGCSLILNHYYDYNIDFRSVFHYRIPDENGLIKTYRVLYDIDFIEISKTSKAKEITQEDVNDLLESYDDISVWKEKFPVNSWIFNGFTIANLIDVSLDIAISDFKSNLLRLETSGGFSNKEFTGIFRTIFGIKDLQIGFTDYNEESESFECVLFKDIPSFILNEKKFETSREALCDASYYTLFKQKELYIVRDAKFYHEKYPKNIFYKKMLDQNIRSGIYAGIFNGDRILGVLELVSPNANDLNTINAQKLKSIMPFLLDSTIRAKENFENELELIIQEECTAIHSSVHWKFRKEAKRYLKGITEGEPVVFREVVFQDVHPLYGQTDIRESSEVRNNATKKDLTLQLQYVKDVIVKLSHINKLPIFSQMVFRINEFLEEILKNLQVDTERKIIIFLEEEIAPFFEYLYKKSDKYKDLVDDYNEMIDVNTGLVYQHRKDYDDAVMHINKRLASILDRKQQEAQAMYPHYFERFKTDGLEHNLYIGESLTKDFSYNQIYLRNLKLWQLQVTQEMENDFFQYQDSLPVRLEVASMILAFSGSLALRFRMDEKRFDVDGTYNARYEVVKKRVDKALIKDTKERVTQPGKITIIYSQKEDEEEYLKYIKFLQHQKLLESDVEIVTLEDLQGVTGLKAIRVGITFSKKSNLSKNYYTYEDLISHINE